MVLQVREEPQLHTYNGDGLRACLGDVIVDSPCHLPCRYMTFWGLTIQIISLALCLLDDLLNPMAPPTSATSAATHPTQRDGKVARPAAARPSGLRRMTALTMKLRLHRLSDAVACMSFAFAHVVTVMFHIIHYGLNGAVEPQAEWMYRPPWICPTIHAGNRWVYRLHWINPAVHASDIRGGERVRRDWCS